MSTTPPLRFSSLKGAKAHIKANNYKLKERQYNRRGIRLQVVDSKGRPRTITVDLPTPDDTPTAA